MPRAWPNAEESYRRRLPARSGHVVFVFLQAIVFAEHMAKAAPHFRHGPGAVDSGSVAYPGDGPQSPLFCLDPQEHGRSLSRFSLVLLHQRAVAPFPEPALPARLRHRAAGVVLAFSFRVALSLE